jgi:poly-gamma-glutamate capsule biosynthesis protein CapA/YwtB (metallophosphatase superfamily)
MGLLITLFMCGDVMTGRGVDQIMPNSVDPTLHEPFVTDARTYLQLATRETGEIDRPVDYDYIWGDALEVLERIDPAARLINLETTITTSNDWDRGKSVHYRMHPRNVRCLSAADIDACVLANNHVLDWGAAGLRETLVTLKEAGIKTAGAGADHEAAEAPAVIEVPDTGRVLVYAFATPTSGVPSDWAASPQRPGVNYLPDLSEQSAERVAALIRAEARASDVVVFSVHWGGNWGYKITDEQVHFAHRLIDEAGVDVVHGHSSHHVLGFEIYRSRPIFYGCGDFLNDYEGITGHETCRPDLTLMYFPSFDPSTGELRRLRLMPMQIRHFRLNRVVERDARWLKDTLNRECKRFGVQVELNEDGMFSVPRDQLQPD